MDQCPMSAFLTNKCEGLPGCSCVSAGRSSRASTGRDFLCFIYNCFFSQLAGHLEHSLLYLESNFCPCWGKLPPSLTSRGLRPLCPLLFLASKTTFGYLLT